LWAARLITLSTGEIMAKKIKRIKPVVYYELKFKNGMPVMVAFYDMAKQPFYHFKSWCNFN
jgi:hypothetical protein